jgi:DNA-binding response OmpR family regulator
VVGAVAGETILLVEDEEIVREPAARFLRRAGYKVLVAGEAATAIDLAAAHTGTIDLLLTDVVMPGMTGKELAEKLLISASIDRVLYTSGYTQDVISRGEGVDTGVTLLAKPFTADQLLAGVRDLLDEQP